MARTQAFSYFSEYSLSPFGRCEHRSRICIWVPVAYADELNSSFSSARGSLVRRGGLCSIDGTTRRVVSLPPGDFSF
jgi:hypothetical protein